jgi:hypothetical protein
MHPYFSWFCDKLTPNPYTTGGGTIDDDTELCQLKRVTPGSLQVGFVWFVGGKVEKMPDNELARCSECDFIGRYI